MITLSSACEEYTEKAEEVIFLLSSSSLILPGQVVLMLEKRKVDGDDNLDAKVVDDVFVFGVMF